jgi:hypothetical protein
MAPRCEGRSFHDSKTDPILLVLPGARPGEVGTMSGLFFGLAFGLGGIGSAVLGSAIPATGYWLAVFGPCSLIHRSTRS